MGTEVNKGKQKNEVLDIDRYRGEWVALEPKSYRVLAHAVSLGTARQAAIEKGVERPVMFSVPESGDLFIGHGAIISRGKTGN